MKNDTASLAARCTRINGDTRIGDLVDFLHDIKSQPKEQAFDRLLDEIEQIALDYITERKQAA